MLRRKEEWFGAALRLQPGLDHIKGSHEERGGYSARNGGYGFLAPRDRFSWSALAKARASLGGLRALERGDRHGWEGFQIIHVGAPRRRRRSVESGVHAVEIFPIPCEMLEWRPGVAKRVEGGETKVSA